MKKSKWTSERGDFEILISAVPINAGSNHLVFFADTRVQILAAKLRLLVYVIGQQMMTEDAEPRSLSS